ncbi:MAG: DUF4397 domain-containing protein [Gammaproteobacteria bacterium]|nr:DUF4397 domain-containing protein [Gammaproteobacteria bacterium]
MKSLKISTLIAIAVLLGACSSSDSPFVTIAPPPPAATVDLQVLHASPDAPLVDIVVNGTAVLEDVDFKNGSGRLVVDAGTQNVEVAGILADGSMISAIGPVDLTLDADTIYTIVAVNDLASIEPVILAQPRTAVSAGSARLNVLHGSASAPAVDIYLTTPGAALTGIAPTATLAFTESTGPVEVAAGDYEVQVTLAGDQATIVYQSGSVALGDGNDLVITAVENTTTGVAPISLMVLDGMGAGEIADKAAGAALRVFHTSPDAPTVDVVVNDNFAAPLVPGLGFPDFAGYVQVPAADYNVKVTAAGNAGAIVIDADLSLEATQAYDVLAIDNLASITALVLNDDPRPVAAYSKVRIVHSSPTAQDVDIYVTAPGTDINTVNATLSDISFAASTGYLDLSGGDYDVTVTPAGTKTAAIGPATLTFADGSVQTVVARDAAGGGAPLNVIITSDLLDD